MICHAEIVQDPKEWGRKQEGGSVFVPEVKNQVMSARLMDLEAGEDAAGEQAGGAVEEQAADGEPAITLAVFPVGEALPRPRR